MLKADKTLNPFLELAPRKISKEGTFSQRIIFPGSPPFNTAEFHVEPGAASVLDSHSVAECWIVAKGKGLLQFNGEEFEVKEGDYLYFPPEHSHMISNTGLSPLLIYSIWW